MLYSTSGSPTLLWVYGTYANVNSEFGTPFKASDKAVYVDGANGAILYNEDTRSFARLASKASYVSYFNADQEEIFDFNNTNRDLLYMHSRTQEGNDWSIVYAIMKDISDGRIYLVSFTLASNTDKAQRSQIEITSLPDIANAIEFEMTHGNVNNNFVFYRTDKQIYALDISSNTHSVVYTAPDNYFISLMKTVNASRCPENDILKGEMDDRMMVFTYNPS